MFFMRSMKRNLIWTLSRIQSKKSTGPFTAQLLRDKQELNTCFLKAALCGRLPSSRVWRGNLLYRVQVAPGPMAALTEDAHSRRGWALCENSLLLYYTHQHAHLKSLTYSKKKTSLMRNLNTCMKKIPSIWSPLNLVSIAYSFLFGFQLHLYALRIYAFFNSQIFYFYF